MSIERREIDEHVVRQFMQMDDLIQFILRSELGAVYQAGLDTMALRDDEDSLLNDQAKALSDLLRENERDARAQQHFGVVSHSQLTPGQRLIDFILYAPRADSPSEQKVIEKTVTLQDEIAEAVMRCETSITELRIDNCSVDFTDVQSGRNYSVYCNRASRIEIEARSYTERNEFQSETPQGQEWSRALGKACWVLDKVMDQTVARIHTHETS